MKNYQISLNPCFSGKWSWRMTIASIIVGNECLNPCFSGKWSWRKTIQVHLLLENLVLILVLVESGLGDYQH